MDERDFKEVFPRLAHRMVATGQEIVREKKKFKVREKPGNFTLSQGKFTSLKKVKEKWNFKSTNLFTAVSVVFLYGQ